MTAYQKLQDEVAKEFRRYFGKCQLYLNKFISPVGIIVNLLKLYLQVDKTKSVCIIVDNHELANQLREIINNTFNNKDNNYNIDVLTKTYCKYIPNFTHSLFITFNIDPIDCLTIKQNTNIKFYLWINNDIKVQSQLNGVVPVIRPTVTVDALIEECIHSPVKEQVIPIYLNDDNQRKYDEYNNYIINTMKIFGNFETLDKARAGDKIMNYSYITVCNNIAINNGWSADLDKESPFAKEIDDVYNPNALHERAILSYTYMRERKDLITDAKEKFDTILDLCNIFKNEKVLIVSARAEYAYNISKYLKENNIKVGNYHDAIPDTIQIDKNGNTIVVKSGPNKGEPKVIGWKKQSTIAEKQFNDGEINVLCIKAASDSKLNIDCDILILTSPLVPNIYDIRRRFQNIYFSSNPLKVYTLFCIGTTEETKIDKREENTIYQVIREDENFIIAE